MTALLDAADRKVIRGFALFLIAVMAAPIVLAACRGSDVLAALIATFCLTTLRRWEPR